MHRAIRFLGSWYFYILDDNKLCNCENLRMGRRNIWDTGKRKQKPEPVNSTSRRAARAAYHDEYPRDFGPRIAYTVSLASGTTRSPIWLGGREMSAPRPHETIPFINQLSSHPTLWSKSLYIQNCSSYFFHVVFTLCLKTLHFCNFTHTLSQNQLFQGSAPF